MTDAAPRIEVVAGILENGAGEILIADRARARSMQEFWEFPGGKLGPAETAEAALRRELKEELDIDVTNARFFKRIEHDYPDFSVGIDFFLVSDWRGDPKGREDQRIKWVPMTTLDEQNLLPADAPVIDALMELG